MTYFNCCVKRLKPEIIHSDIYTHSKKVIRVTLSLCCFCFKKGVTLSLRNAVESALRLSATVALTAVIICLIEKISVHSISFKEMCLFPFPK